jgi:hypothetical protein
MRLIPLTALSLVMSITPAGAAEVPDYALTVYSAAAPGTLSTERLADYGDRLPGYAVVSDRRTLELSRGTGELRFSDVASRIDPTTVSFASLTDPSGTRVLEQNYQYDLVSQQKLLQRYLGEQLSVEQVRGDTIERTEGRLLSADGGLILSRADGSVVSLSNWSSVQFPALPGGLISKPTLVWTLDAARGGAHQTQVSYQTQGMTWWTDYNLTLREDSGRCRMDLAAWVSLVNQSGGSFPNARLKLVAGDVNRAPAAPAQPKYLQRAMVAESTMDAGFAESELFEYHLYTLGRRTDLPDNSVKQLELFPSITGADCRRELVFTASPMYQPWGQAMTDQGFGATQSGEAGAFLEFSNTEANRLGLPLPGGRVRVSQAAADGALEFIGEDLIKHTARGETLRLKLGTAFDISGERRQVDFSYDEKARTITETIEVEVRNGKQRPQEVTLREYLYRWSGWRISGNSQTFDKRDAQTVDFALKVPAEGKSTVRYTVTYSW